MHKADIARAYRDRFGMDMPTKKLARIIYSENNLIYKDMEDARTVLRGIEGKKGKKDRHKQTHKLEAARPRNPYNLPKSDEETNEPYYIKGHKKGLILNDIHLPYHSVEALTAAIDFAKKDKPDFILLNGDIVDFHGVSYFQKDPHKKRFSEELDMLKDFIASLKSIFNCKIYYKLGNHEYRYNSFLYQKAHELSGVEEFKLEEIIAKRCPDVEIISDKTLIIIAGLPFLHGHEFGRGLFNPVNSARGLFLQAKNSAVKGDSHVTSEHSETDVMGRLMTTYSIGCLCGLTPKWLPFNKWNHGFGMIDIIDENNYKFRNYRIYNGVVL